MREAFAVVRLALEDVWDHLFVGAACSLLWLLLVLLVIPGPPATIALVEIARRIQSRESMEVGEYLRAVGRNFGLGWRWGLAALPVILVLAVDLAVIPMLLAPGLVLPARVFVGLALALWLLLQLLVVPLLFEQEQPAVLLAHRNAAVMVLRHPGYALVLLVAAAALTWVSLLLVIVSLLATPMFLAFLGARAVRDRLALWRAANEQP